MLRLNLPDYTFKIGRTGENLTIFDQIRKKFLVLTPEEWVRQNFVRFLIEEKGYTSSFIANEVTIKLHNTVKRCDTVVYDHYLNPLMIIEYKAPEIAITQAVFDQISRYNIRFKVPFLLVSNGLNHYCCQVNYETQTIQFLTEIPLYTELSV